MPSPKLRPSDRSYAHPEGSTEGYIGNWEAEPPASPEPIAKATATPTAEPTAPEPIAKLEPPEDIGEWTIQETIAALSRKIPDSLLSTKSQGKSKITFISWYVVNSILDKYSPGWTWEIRSVQFTNDRVFVVGRLSLNTCEGIIYREATGSEELKNVSTNQQTGEVTIKEIAYGDPSSNAESMSFRRAAARFGLGLYLYDK